ncbi:MAG: hypothetical protein C0601_08850 [Candidatus Muiribacterium halophilum]|uniref:asparagine synthase (glutamine-hydrolyzing) n=1 Tax=Muiribacterium halophilum TaxID=2053465 RepID=A0A2N5ZE86_MUIH1|nr:MAG: hypothetical protein C0601_08850 [Candidatus Muirbacterium halophilum]
MRLFFNNRPIILSDIEKIDSSIVKIDDNVSFQSDEFGYAPVYYYKDDHEHHIFDNTKACLDLKEEFLDKQALCDFLRYRFIPDGKTLDKRIIRLGPQDRLILNEENIVFSKKEETIFEKQNRLSLKDLLIRYFEKIRKKEVHIMFSGGIDSTLLVIAAYLAGKEVFTYSIDIQENGFSEAKFRKDIIKRYVKEHKELLLSKEDYLSALKALIDKRDIPFIYQDTSAFVWLIEKSDIPADEVFFGLGGDEWFFGYDRMVFSYMERILSNRFDLDSYGSDDIKGLSSIILSEIKDRVISPFKYISKVFDQDIISKVLLSKVYPEKNNQFKDGNTVNSIIDFEYKQEFPFNQAVRLNSIQEATGKKILLPFIQEEIFQLAIGLSFEDMMRNGRKKDIFFKEFKDYLPEDILKKKKSGFRIPLKNWFESEAWDIINKLVLNKPSLKNILNISKLEYEVRNKYTSEQKWYIMMLIHML